MVTKNAKLGQRIRAEKRARIGANLPSDEQRVSWRLGDADLAGPYAWNSISSSDLARLIDVFREVDKKRWSAVMGEGMGEIKSIPRTSLCAAAQRRLETIKRDDESWLHEIRLGNKPRVWGIRDDNVFHVLWWDPEHDVCPAELRNT